MICTPRLRAVLLAPMLACLAAAPALASTSLTMSPAAGHPKIGVSVRGSGFAPDEAVDIYFDTTDMLLAVTDDSGAFGARKLSVPAGALPGAHWITAVGRKSGDAVQKLFTARTDWSQFGFDERGKRTNSYENVLDAQSARALDLMWKTPLCCSAIETSPIVSKGLVYVATFDNKLHAVAASTGIEKWTATTGGTIAWYQSPAVSNGVVYIGSMDGKLYAFDAATGAAKWTAATGGTNVVSIPVVAYGIVYVGSSDGKFYAFDALTGAAIWSTALTAGTATSNPVAVAGVVYVGSTSGIYAFDAFTGALKWGALGGAGVRASIAVANGRLFAMLTDRNLYALETDGGGVVWTAAISDGWSLAVANNAVYVGTYDGFLEPHSASTGAWLSATFLGGGAWDAPAVANGVAYIRSMDGRIYGIDAGAGGVLWSAIDHGSASQSSPAVADGVVYSGSVNGNLYAFAIDGGRNAVYHRDATPPSYAKLRPDFRLKP